MAQNALTVTNPNPTPPTNFVNSGSTPPNPATWAANVTDPPTNWLNAPFYDDGPARALPCATLGGSNSSTINEDSSVTTWPTAITFAAKKAALAVGGTSVDHEQLGAETSVTATSSNPSNLGQLKMVGVGPAMTAAIRAAGPNASHASSLSPTTPLTPTTVATPSAPNNVANGGAVVLTVPGTNFDRTSIVNINGVPQNTNYVSSTSLTVTNAVKRTSAGTYPITVTNGSSGITSNATNWTMT
jgi:hypothetical protein